MVEYQPSKSLPGVSLGFYSIPLSGLTEMLKQTTVSPAKMSLQKSLQKRKHWFDSLSGFLNEVTYTRVLIWFWDLGWLREAFEQGLRIGQISYN
jgi:hypothetical protein